MMQFNGIVLTAPRPLNSVDEAVEDMSRVICGLLVVGLKRRLKFTEVSKISIRINKVDDPDEGKVLLGVLIVNRQFPSVEFVKWDLLRRQNYMLDFVSNVLKDVCVAQGQDATVVDEARSFVVEHNFRRTIVGKKRFPGPERRSSAHIECDQEMDGARIYIAARLPGGQVRRVEVATDRPDEFILQCYFGKLDWTGPRTITLHTVDGDTFSAEL
jgi:hypothetical protein